MSRTKPRRVNANTPLVGDVVRAVTDKNGVTVSSEGRIGRVEYSGSMRSYFAVGGGLIYTWLLSGDNPTVFLLEAVPADQTPLFD